MLMLEWLAGIPRLELAEPLWLLLLPLLAVVARLIGAGVRRGTTPAMLFPALERLRNSGFEASRLTRLPEWLRWTALVFLLFSLTGPRLHFYQTESERRGIDVILALDISESMLQKSATGESRLDAAREVARSFVLRRSNDRIGLVVFRGKGYTQCPLTLDHEVLAMLLDHLSPRVIREDGTAIGTAILIAVNRLKVSASSHRVLILITDGESNAGEVDPATAARIAARNGIRIYAVNAGFKISGIGKNGGGESGSHAVADEESLQSVTSITGGGYFRVDDPTLLDQTIKAIDRIEKKQFAGPVMEYRVELFFWFLLPALAMLLLEALLSNTRLLRIP